MTSVTSVTGMRKDSRTYLPSDELVLSTCAMGVEIEVERCVVSGRKREQVGELWNLVPDGSLRNHGMEFVFCGPLFGKDVISALNTLCPLLDKWGVETTERTSVHVHVDVRDMEMVELYNLFIYYLIFERLLYKYAGKGRDENIFCLPYHSADFQCHRAFEMLSTNNGQVRRLLSNFNKYSGLNLNAIVNLGTIEFRHLAGTIDRDRIVEWINIVQRIKAASMGGRADIREVPNQMSMLGPEDFVREFFGEQAEALIASTDSLYDDLYEGVRTAQDAIHGYTYEQAVEKHTPNRETGVAPKFRNFLSKKNIHFPPELDHYNQEIATVQLNSEREDAPVPDGVINWNPADLQGLVDRMREENGILANARAQRLAIDDFEFDLEADDIEEDDI